MGNWCVGRWAAFLALIALGCSSGGGGERAQEQPTRAQREAVTTPPSTTLALALTYPKGVPLTSVFMSASDHLQIDDRVTLAQAGQLPIVAGLGSSATGGVELGASAQAHANVDSGAGVMLRSTSHVFGSVTAAGLVTKQQADVKIDGQTLQNTPVPAQTTSFNVTFPGATLGAIDVGPDGPVVPIAPGAYAGLNVRSRAHVSLSAGTYYFDSINTEPQSDLQLKGAPIYVYVKTAFTYKGAFNRISGADGQILVGYFGTSDAFIQAPFVGTIVAPNANIALQRPTSGQHRGTFFGNRVEAYSDSSIAFLPFSFSVGCPFGDSDNDGLADCDDACNRDPLKTTAGECGCGHPDTDTDHDGVADCKDECPNDPGAQRSGDCGCPSAPAAAGTPCGDSVCGGAQVCNGAGVCGNPSQCAPAANCVLKSFNGEYYWFCPGSRTFDQASASCRGVHTALAQVDTEAENTFLTANVGTAAWIGANDRAVEGQWRWATVTDDQGARFWDGGAGGLRYFSHFSAWAPASPVDGGEDCATLSSSGTWLNTSCTASAGFVCEVPVHGPGYRPPLKRACEILGTKCEDVQPEPACQGDANAQEAALFANLDDQQTLDLFNACNAACQQHGQDSPECTAACTGPAAPPLAGSTCPDVSIDDTRPCALKQTVPANAPASCVTDADCAAFPNAVCGVFYPCDVAARMNTVSPCFASNPTPPAPGVSSSGTVCGIPVDGCPQVNAPSFPARCTEVSICSAPPQTVADANGPGSNLSDDAFDPQTTFFNPPALQAATPFPDDSHPCGPGGCPATADHPWCKLGLQDAVPTKDGEQPTKSGRSPGSDVSFNFDPQLQFEHSASISAFGIPKVNLTAQAGFSANVQYGIAGGGTVPVIDVQAGLSANECGVDGSTTLSVFGVDFVPLLTQTQSGTFPLPLTQPSQDQQKACRTALDNFQNSADRVKKAFRDATTLLRQYKDAVKNDVAGDVTTTTDNLAQTLCSDLLTERPRGFPPGDCSSETPEQTINRFITYYERTITGFAGLDSAKGLQETLGDLVAKIPDLDQSFQLFDLDRHEEVTVASVQFFIGPIPVNLEVITTADYGADIDAVMTLKPGTVVASMLPFSQGSAEQDIAYVQASGMPHAGVGLGAFCGVGFSVAGVTAKVGIEADLNLGDVYVPVSAGAGVTLGSELDKNRALESDLTDLVTGDELLPTKRYTVGLHYSAQLNASIRDILSGHIDGKLKLKFFFFSKTWRKTLLNFNGFCHGDPNSPLQGCDLHLISLGGGGDVASGSIPWGSLRQAMPFPKLAPIMTRATPGLAKADTTVVGKFFYDSLCTCIDGDNPADTRECFRSQDCCSNEPVCFHDPSGAPAKCIACRAATQSCNVDSECCSGNVCNGNVCKPQQPCNGTCSRDAECESGLACVKGTCFDAELCEPK